MIARKIQFPPEQVEEINSLLKKLATAFIDPNYRPEKEDDQLDSPLEHDADEDVAGDGEEAEHNDAIDEPLVEESTSGVRASIQIQSIKNPDLLDEASEELLEEAFQQKRRTRKVSIL